MNIVFMGTPDLAKTVLQSVFLAGHTVLAAVTQPDKPKGRGKELASSPVKQFAKEKDIPVYQPKKVQEEAFLESLKYLNPDVILVAAFGQLLTKEVLKIPKYGCLNVHASLLPKYRGAAPIQRCILEGENETGITIMQMDEGLDTGDILEKIVIPIEKEETGGSLFEKLANAAGSLLLETLEKAEKGLLLPKKQDDTCFTYAPILKKEEGKISFSKDAVVIERMIRGMSPWPSAYTRWNGKTLKIWKAKVIPESEESDLEPGTVCKIEKEACFVKTGNGMLKLLEVQLEGKKRMGIAEFLRGYPVKEGMIFGKE